MRKVTKRIWVALLAPALLLLTTGADHRDAPGLLSDPAADINDVYAFVNPNTNNIVLAMTVNPFTAPGINATFSPDCLYQFKIDNTGAAVEDLVIQVTFDTPTGSASNATQNFTVVGPVKPAKTGVVGSLVKSDMSVTGPINNSGSSDFTTGSNGIKVFAGIRDDPFFFDFVYVIGFLNNKTPKRNPGIDFFAGFNVSIIAIELPASMLKGADNNIRVWGTTSLPSSFKRAISSKKGAMPGADDKGSKTYVQKDRMGNPAINTVLIASAHKNAFNLSSPSDDKANFRQDVVDHVLALNGGDQTHAQKIADVVLPDMLTLDVTKTDGFLNGRRPQDDVIDAELNLLTKGAVPSDGVDANDVPFLPDFPFFAPPHAPSEGVPKRN